MDRFDTAKRSSIMRCVASKDTAPELAVRRLIHELGFRFRLHRRELPGKPDIVLPAHKLAIFVHGCFWHQHRNCRRSNRPASNVDFWIKKLDRNIVRDAENKRRLRKLGWKVVVIWECETANKASLERTIRRSLPNRRRSQEWPRPR